MNKEDTKKCIAVMQAYVDGCEIYYCDIPSDKPAWNWDNFTGKYKVVPKPKYRPFTAVEALDLIGRIIENENGWATRIQSINKGNFFYWCGEELHSISFEKALEWILKPADTPCGVLVEDDNES